MQVEVLRRVVCQLLVRDCSVLTCMWSSRMLNLYESWAIADFRRSRILPAPENLHEEKDD